MKKITAYELEEGWVAIATTHDEPEASVGPVRATARTALLSLLDGIEDQDDGAGECQEDGAEECRQSPSYAELSARARAAYNAYAHRVGYKSVGGEPLPTWEGLGTPVRNAWRDAAAAVVVRT